jgi:hypothetical protein
MNALKIRIPCSLFFFCFAFAYGHSQPQMRLDDRIRIKEAMDICKQYGDSIWPGINAAPFAIIVVTDSAEFLINHSPAPAGFNDLGYDSLLGSRIYCRKPVFNKHFLATFPAVEGSNTIVVGTPENTGKNSTDWIITLLHEHFHQYANSDPAYYTAVGKLDLSGGDKTGMWMLNYPFPYNDSAVVVRYEKYAAALLKTVRSIGTDSFQSSFSEYASGRRSFERALKPPDYRYFSFQIWQEGIARYTEYKFLQLLDAYTPAKDVARLPDFVPFKKYREEFYRNQLNRIAEFDLAKDRRTCFYAVGFAEGLILDELNPSWRMKYLVERFFVEKYAGEFDSRQ